MKKGVVILSLLLSLFLTPAYSATPPKAGSVCSKQGTTKTYQGKKFKCIKVKNQLVWGRGTATGPKTTPTQKQTSDPYLISPAAINSFQDAVTQYIDIKYWAWQKATNAVETNNLTESTLDILIGPNAKDCTDAGFRAVRLIQKLYTGSQLPVKSTLLYASKDDHAWTKTMLIESFPDSNPPQVYFGVNKKYEAFVLHSDSCDSKDKMATSGASIGHGYTHVLQKVAYLDSKENWGSFPRWLIEGAATYSENFIQYGKDYKTWITNPTFHNWDLKQYDVNFYQDFYDYKLQSNGKYSWVHTDQWPNQRVYDVGSYACEVLVAIKGPSSIIRLNSEFAKSGNFEKSFENVYGLSWTEALPLIARAVYKSTNWLIDTPNGLR